MHIKFKSENLKDKPLGRSRRRCEDVIEMDIEERGREDVNWIHLQ
jgi:hypothetical protein